MTFPNHFFAWKSINLEWHGLKNILFAYASTEGSRKIFFDMFIGLLTADMYQIFKEKKYK